jgi:hypothetical protein
MREKIRNATGAGSGKVPALQHGTAVGPIVVWDSLAICECVQLYMHHMVLSASTRRTATLQATAGQPLANPMPTLCHHRPRSMSAAAVAGSIVAWDSIAMCERVCASLHLPPHGTAKLWDK